MPLQIITMSLDFNSILEPLLWLLGAFTLGFLLVYFLKKKGRGSSTE